MLDKNGKPYKLFSSPNPLVLEQIRLPENELIFHNFKFNPKIVNLKTETYSKSTKVPEPIKIEEPLIIEKPIPLIKEEIIEPIIIEEPIVNKPLIEEEIAEEPLIDPEIPQEGIILVHCHPLLENNNFGKKFIFEAYIVESNDIEICLYTKQKNIPKGSILYPSKYKDGEKLGMLRWWKISSIKQQDDEFLLFGQITNEQRSF